MRSSRGDRAAAAGYSLMEFLVVMGIAAATLLIVMPHSLRWLNAQENAGAVYQTQMLLQLARMEAVSRNRPCRFEVLTDSKSAVVYDLNDPSDPADDLVIASSKYSGRVSFVDPQGNPAVTLANLGANRFGATFISDGSVSAGTGQVEFEAKGNFRRVSLMGAGGTRAEIWNGSSWSVGP